MRAAILLAGLVAVSACAPRVGPNDTVSLVPVGADARDARDAALRGGPTAPANSSAVAGPAPVPGQLGDDTTFTGQGRTPVAATPPPESYRIVAPEPLPPRPSDSGPGVVGFALATDHPVGQAVYGRSAPSPERAERACARYPSDDLAQAAFLNAGGPESDPQGVDPDGDGYACDWNPERFRRAIR
jgi:hypothetical protein